jgi:organic radical activating enzyme
MSYLPVMEHFYTLQGEGCHQGKAAYFIRLGGCDVGCVWCDVKESWDASVHPQLSIPQIIEAVQQSMNDGIVVITGGEPLMHPLDELTAALHNAGYRCHLETSGAHPLSGTWDWICVSPKKFKAPLTEVLLTADELKVVVFNTSDFNWAEEHAGQTKKSCLHYLQPEWDKREKISPLIIQFIQQHPSWQLSLQVHKYLNIP